MSNISLQAKLEELKERIRAAETVVVGPDGSLLNYVTEQAPSATTEDSLSKTAIDDIAKEQSEYTEPIVEASDVNLEQNVIENTHSARNEIIISQDVISILEKAFSQGLTTFYREELVKQALSVIKELEMKNEILFKMQIEIENMKREINRLRNIIRPISSLNELDDLEEERKQKYSLRKILRKRLYQLQLQRATQGIQTPPAIDMEIDSLHIQLEEIDARIRLITYEIEHLKSETDS